jgi:hypothetical protein
MSVWCSGRGGFTRGRGHEFEPRQPRSVATLREKMRDLRFDREKSLQIKKANLNQQLPSILIIWYVIQITTSD